MERRKAITPDIDRYLRYMYFNPKKSGSFSGITQFYNAVKEDGKYNLSKYMVSKWLRRNDVYTTTRKITPKFLRPTVNVAAVDETWEIDLADFSLYASDNDGYKMVLVCIDIFSRYLWCRPLKSKSASDVIEGLKNIVSEGRKPLTIRSDSGHDVYNSEITQQFMIPNNIKQYVTHNELQANYVERVIKTIKSRIWKYFRHMLRPRWIDVLQDIVKSYNVTVHSSLGVKPSEVNKDNQKWIALDQAIIKKKKYARYYAKMKPKLLNPVQYKFKKGDHVRIPNTRNKVRREYKEKWTNEVYVISFRFHRQGLNVYKVKDLHEKPLGGTFAEAELQKVVYDPKGVFYIDEVVGKKYIGRRLYLEIRWYGWPKSFNSYIPASDINKYKRKT